MSGRENSISAMFMNHKFENNCTTEFPPQKWKFWAPHESPRPGGLTMGVGTWRESGFESQLENPMDGGAWWATVHGVAKSLTRLHFHFHFSLSCIGERNGNPLQCSCLENPRDGAASWAVVYGVAQNRTRLKRLSSSSSERLKTCPGSYD